MKKPTKQVRSLKLSRETIKSLTPKQLKEVVGGGLGYGELYAPAS